MRIVVERGLPREKRSEMTLHTKNGSDPFSDRRDSGHCGNGLRAAAADRLGTAGGRTAGGVAGGRIRPAPERQMLPLDTVFLDETGRAVRIGDYFGKRPVVLAFVYYGCPMLCLQSLSSLASTLGVMSEIPGKDFEVVSISIDPRETPAMALREEEALRRTIGKTFHRQRLALPDGNRSRHPAPDPGRRLSLRVGRTHAAVCASGRHRCRHTPGQGLAVPVRHRLRTARSTAGGAGRLRGKGRLSAREGAPLLLPLRPRDRPYTLAIMRIVQMAGAATVLSLGTLIVVWTRRERRQVSKGHVRTSRCFLKAPRPSPTTSTPCISFSWACQDFFPSLSPG